MRFISDAQYYMMDSSKDIDKIINDYSLLEKGTGNFLDGCTVEFFQVGPDKRRNGNQMMFTPSGGAWGQGYLQYTKYVNDDTNKKFVLQWFSGGEGNGYYMWPNNNSDNNAIKLFAALPNPKKNNDDARVNAANYDPKGTKLFQRLFKFSNLSTNSEKKLITELSILSTEKNKGRYNIGVNTQSEITSREAPSPAALWEVKFISLGKNAWSLAMKNDPTNAIKYKGCFKDTFNLDAYPNYMDAFNEVKVDCNAGKPVICETALGFDSDLCKSFCNTTGNEIKCLPNLKVWCTKPENYKKPECACFDLDGYKKYNCDDKGVCLYQEGMPYCYYPPCLKSGMSKVYKADKGECPRNSITYQECVQKITDSTISAKEINLRCNMNSGNSTPTAGGAVGGGSSSSTPVASGGESFFSKYKGLIIGGSVGLGVLILLMVGIFIYYKSRSKSSAAGAVAADNTTTASPPGTT